MKLTAFQQLFPSPLEPMVDPSTGAFTNSGRYFLQQIWNRTGQGSGVVPSVALGLVATGANQAGALALTDDWNSVDTVGAGTGVRIPALQPGQQIAIWNTAIPTLNIYPSLGIAIDAVPVNGAYVLAGGKMQIFWVHSLALMRSTQLG